MTANGFPASTFTESGALPTGVTFNDTTGLLEGTPVAGTGGVYPITFTASNGVSPPATQTFTLAIYEAPQITSANSTTFTVGSNGTFTVTSSGFPVPQFTETGTLPAGVSFNSSTGLLTGTPLPGSGGTYTLQIFPHNIVAAGTTQIFTLDVGEAPTITSASTAVFSVGNAGIFDVTANGFPASTFTESGTLPTGVTFNDTTGLLAGTPVAGTGGVYPITFTASNGVSPPATQTFTLAIYEAPQITSANSTTFTVGSNGTFTVTSSGFPVPQFTETGTLPAGVSFNSSTGLLTGTPLPGSGGTYTLQIFPHNIVAAGTTQIFTLDVGEAPTITSASTAVFSVGNAGIFDVTANGFPASTFAETGTLPHGVSFNQSTGILSGTPLPGTGATYALMFTPMNGVATGPSQNFTLIVDEAPTITSTNGTTFTVGTNGSFDVTTTGFPAATIALTGMLPNGVNFNSSTGVLSGTPLVGTSGIYTLTFAPTNTVGGGPAQTFTLIVDQAPTFTNANTTIFTVGAGERLHVHGFWVPDTHV